MNAKITFCPETVKTLTARLHAALAEEDIRQIKRVMALLALSDHQSVEVTAQRLGVCVQTIYN